MKIEFDPIKSERNARERNLPFELAADIEWETAIGWDDLRRPYAERRVIAFGILQGRLHMICYTPIPDGIRVISLRRANEQELRRYAPKTLNE